LSTDASRPRRVNPARAESSRTRAKLFLGGDVADSTQRDPRAARPAGAAGGAARPPLRFSLNDGARAFGRTLMMMGARCELRGIAKQAALKDRR